MNKSKNISISKQLRDDDQCKGFDNNCGDAWIYPTNYPKREYQYHITKKALFQNTLVVLPTGLGKTFIAAVVMYNFYRWYPKGKVIFMAPTRPLVTQQIDACYKIMGIPKVDTIELTGQQAKQIRSVAWRTKRVFFITPHVLNIDIADKDLDFPVEDIRLIVIDEAHKARGRYAYVQVIKAIMERHQSFRILGLSATPGKYQNEISEVIKNLQISSMEVRSDESLDVLPYTHKKTIESVTVRYSDQLRKIKESMEAILDPYINNLVEQNILQNSKYRNRFFLIKEQQRFRETNPHHPQRSAILSDFSISVSLYHALELLERHGMRIFLSFFTETNSNQEKFLVWKVPKLKELLNEVRTILGTELLLNESIAINQSLSDEANIDYGHPKYEILEQRLLKHFQDNGDTRAIIFCEYRESVYLIRRMLYKHRPLLKPIVLVGKGGSKNITQKQQKTVMNDFRNGVSNILVATCVAEEGIDVGEVDLIICFDINTTNPTRMIQRIGRTGRKREGKVVMLATEGAEQSVLKNALGARSITSRKLTTIAGNDSIYCQSLRLVPTEFNPKCMEVLINVDVEKEEEDEKRQTAAKSKKTSTKTRNNKKKQSEPISNQVNDLRTFFKTKPQFTDSVEYDFEIDDFDNCATEHEAPPGESNIIQDQSSIIASSKSISDLISTVKSYQKLLRKKAANDPKQSSENNSTKHVDIFPKLFENLPAKPNANSNFVLESLEKEKFPIEISFEATAQNSISSVHSIVNNSNESINDVHNHDDEFIDSNFIEHESKYAKNFVANSPKSALNQLKSSTPLVPKPQMKRQELKNSSIVDSPLAKAFNRSIEKNSNRQLKNASTWKYFLVSSLDDIFADDIINDVKSEKEVENVKSVSTNGNNSISNIFPSFSFASHLAVEEKHFNASTKTASSELTISKINEKVNLNRSGSCDQNDKLNISIKDLDIGTIDDIFANDDDDIDDDCNVPIDLNDANVGNHRIDFSVNQNLTNSNSKIHQLSPDNDSIPSSQPFGTILKAKSILNGRQAIASNENKINKSLSENSIKENVTPDLSPSNNIIESTPHYSFVEKNQRHRMSPTTKVLSPSNSLHRSPSLLNKKLNFPTLVAKQLFHMPTTGSDQLNTHENSDEEWIGGAGALSNNMRIDLNNASPVAAKVTETVAFKGDMCKRRLITSDESSPEPVASSKQQKPIVKRQRVQSRKKRRKKCAFIADECDVSDDDDGDDNDFDEDDLSQQLQTQFVCNETTVDENPNIDMYAKYLQSIRSPIRKPGAFRIPDARKYQNMPNIYSQIDFEDDEDDSMNIQDSFVVDDPDEAEADKINELSVLEQAEQILKQRRKERRRKRTENAESCIMKNPIKKRRKIIAFNEDSDSSDGNPIQ